MKKFLRLSVALVALLSVTHAQGLPQLVAPADVGLSKERLDRIRVAMEKEIAENRLAGGIGLIAHRGSIPADRSRVAVSARIYDHEGGGRENESGDGQARAFAHGEKEKR